jgi:hypothetical protein
VGSWFAAGKLIGLPAKPNMEYTFVTVGGSVTLMRAFAPAVVTATLNALAGRTVKAPGGPGGGDGGGGGLATVHVTVRPYTRQSCAEPVESPWRLNVAVWLPAAVLSLPSNTVPLGALDGFV